MERIIQRKLISGSVIFCNVYSIVINNNNKTRVLEFAGLANLLFKLQHKEEYLQKRIYETLQICFCIPNVQHMLWQDT